jgi:hypothetical protein
MGLFSKLFGSPKPISPALAVPDQASVSEVIQIAIRSVIQEAGGNCASLELVSDSDYWVQIMDCTINCYYPHKDSPEERFPDLCKLPVIAGLEDYEAELSMTVSLKEMNVPETSKWIERYFSEVLSVDLPTAKLKLRMAQL